MRTKSRWVLAATVVFGLAAMIGCANAKNNRGNGTVWVATQGDQKLTSFSINLGTGALSQVGHQVSTGVTPAALAMSADAKTVFLANAGDGTIGAYPINSDGSLGANSCNSCKVGLNPVALAADPTGTVVFVANQGIFADNTSGTVSVVNISSGAAVTFPTETPADTTGTGPSGVAISPVSFSCNAGGGAQTCYTLYVTNQFTNTVTSYNYYLSNGTFNIAAVNGPYTAGANPTALAFSRCAGVSSKTQHCATNDGNNLFVANAGSNDVTIFTACIQAIGPCTNATPGTLLPNPGTSSAGIGPVSLIVNPVADFVYSVDQKSDQISQFSYSPATAVLTALTPAAVSTALTPVGGGVTSDGSTVVVPNSGSSNVSVYRVSLPSSTGASSASGRLIPANPATVSLSGQPSAVLVR
jgi:6-phosphogluconolactonase (cycloisomerase 2 family)